MAKLNAKQAAASLGVSSRHIYVLAAPAGPVPCYRIGTRIVFDEDDLNRYLESCRTEPVPRLGLKLHTSPIKLKASDPNGESDFEKSCRRLGLTPRRRSPSAKGR